MNKLIIPIIIIVIIAAGIGAYFVLQESAPAPQVRCGDGVCGPVERQRGVCPKDCGSELPGGSTETRPEDHEDSPFGISGVGGGVGNRWEDNVNHLTDLNVYWVGAQSRIEGISWGDIQTSKDSLYDWSITDNTVNILQERNINYFSVFYPVASWDLESCYDSSQLKKKKSGLYTPKLPCDLEIYGRFIEAAVERYDGDGKNDMPGLKFPITYWMTIAEPDNPGDWYDTGENYGVLIKTIYEAIKRVDPGAKLVVHGSAFSLRVIGGGLDSYGSGGFFYKTFSKLKELSPSEKYRDLIWGFHYTTDAGTYLISKDIINSMNSMTENLGYGTFPLWVTETGTFSGMIGTVSQSEKQQAGDLFKRFVFNMGEGAKKVFWVRLLDSSFEPGPFKGVGLLTLDGSGKLSYYTYKKMVEVLEGSDWDNIQTIQESNGIYIYKFTKNNKPIWVVWNDNSAEKQITISGITSNQVQITQAIPKYSSGKEVIDYDSAFTIETKSVQNGKVTFGLKDIPVFVEEQ